MNIENATKLADFVDALSDEQFNMGHFMRLPDGNTLHTSVPCAGRAKEFASHCGTAGCWAGWAVALLGDKKNYMRNTIEYEAAQLLGLEIRQAEQLFFGRWAGVKYYDDLTDIPKDVAVKFLRRCIAEGKVPQADAIIDGMWQTVEEEAA